MKEVVYMRVAKQSDGRMTAEANSKKAINLPLLDGRDRPIPTVYFALEIDIPDGLFNQAEQVIASVEIPKEAAEVAANVTPVVTRKKGRRS